MPTITYSGTGDAQSDERDATLAELRDWTDGHDNRTLNTVGMREDVDAVSISFKWEVPLGEASTRISALDDFITDDSRIPAELPKPSEGGVSVTYP